MANQYCGSFEHVIQNKFNCTAEDALKQCVDEGLTYAEAEEKLGFKHGTIRKWAKRFDLKLQSGEPSEETHQENFEKFFRQQSMNRYNFLSRQWLALGAA
ncbi:MAG: helix-turn-helix domain-containing protein [Gammaproteobacteria bacterium]|nr:MAG: helix-turn-helix domain-containing protein [Gammaproteobacteria bacterium]UTW42931.1 helix-turn-helix domain-containing protein [bacterium SCSIO 12844]